MGEAILAEWYYVPRDKVKDITALKKRLTFTPPWYNKDEPAPSPIENYDEDSIEGYVGLPIAFGMRHYPMDYDNECSNGRPLPYRKLPDPYHELAHESQPKFIADILEHFEYEHTCLGVADTGTGKTPVGLYVAAKLGVSTLVITHLSEIGEQWVADAKSKLGLKASEIGWIRGDTCEYDRPFCVGLVQSLSRREYVPEVYTAFGTVIYDEIHRFPSEVYSRALFRFLAQNRLAMSATDERSDGAHVIIHDHFGGHNKVVAVGDALPVQVRVEDFYTSNEYWGTMHGARMKCLSLMRDRNERLTDIIVELYNDDRQILVVAESINHLQGLEAACLDRGIPAEHMGQFTGQRYYYEPKKGGEKGYSRKTHKIAKHYLKWVRDNAIIVFATWGMVKEGINIPRLDAGVDATPRSNATQILGRIRRPFAGKDRVPVWVTLRDMRCPTMMGYWKKRLKDYKKSGTVEVIKDGKRFV